MRLKMQKRNTLKNFLRSISMAINKIKKVNYIIIFESLLEVIIRR